MFGVDSGELFIIVLIAVVVIGPKDLPRVMRSVGRWVGKARGMAGQFRSGVDQMVRDSEIADLEKKWREQNEAIMRAHPNAPPVSDWGLPPPPASTVAEGEPPPLAQTARPAPAPPLLGKGGAPTRPRVSGEVQPAAAPKPSRQGPVPPEPVKLATPVPRRAGGEPGPA